MMYRLNECLLFCGSVTFVTATAHFNNTYYDHMAAKYQGGVRGTPYRDPRAPAYPSYLNEEYLYGPTGHPYVQHVPYPYE